jgi:hypothetical protein
MIAITASDLMLDESYALFSQEATRSRPLIGAHYALTNADIHSFKRVALQPSAFAPAFSRLDEFARFGPDWDSYGASPLSHEAIDVARVILHRLHELSLDGVTPALAPYHAAPSPDGGVAIEWRRDGRSMELWIGPNGSLAAIIDDSLDDATQREFQSVETAIAAIEAVIG